MCGQGCLDKGCLDGGVWIGGMDMGVGGRDVSVDREGVHRGCTLPSPAKPETVTGAGGTHPTGKFFLFIDT